MQNFWLIAAACCSFVVAALHVAVIIGGAAAYRYFGAGEKFAQAQEQGSYVPALITSGIVAIFTAMGIYTLSAAGIGRDLPAARTIVLVLGIVYLLRGLVVFVELGAALNLFSWREAVRPQDPWFSAISLLFGVIHLIAWFKTRY